MLPRIGRIDNQASPRHNSPPLPLSLMCCTQLLEPTAFSSVSCFFPTLQMSSSLPSLLHADPTLRPS
ncbi:hypothetical protein V8C44DRAFT_297323 [Trichoderma aethiopicum]